VIKEFLSDKGLLPTFPSHVDVVVAPMDADMCGAAARCAMVLRAGAANQAEKEAEGYVWARGSARRGPRGAGEARAVGGREEGTMACMHLQATRSSVIGHHSRYDHSCYRHRFHHRHYRSLPLPSYAQ